MEEQQNGRNNQDEKPPSQERPATEPVPVALPPLVRSRVPQNAPPVDPPRAER